METTRPLIRFFQKNQYLIPILAMAFVLRISFWQEVKHTPITDGYKLPHTDMEFFNAWADEILKSDLLFDQSYHPLHDWHIGIVKEALPEASETEIKALWDKWYGGKQFHQAPGYPYLIALVRQFIGNDPAIIYGLQIGAGLLGLLLLMLTTKHLFGDSAAAVVGIFYSLCGPIMYYEAVLSRESLLSASYCVILFAILSVIKKQSFARTAFLGAMTGLLILQKESHTLFAGTLVICLWLQFRHHEQRFKIIGVVIAGIVLPLLPLLIRNYLVGVPVTSLSSVGPITFLASNHSATPIGYGWYTPSNLFEIMNRTEGKGFPVVLETLRTYDNLLILPQKILLRAIEFWTPEEIPNNLSYRMAKEYLMYLKISGLDFRVLNALALGGLFLGLRDIKKLWPLFLVFGITFISCLGTYNLSRFRAPVLPVLILFAGYFLVAFVGWAENRMVRRCAVAIFFVMIVWGINYRVEPEEFGKRCASHVQIFGSNFVDRLSSDPQGAFSKLEQALQLEEACLQQTNGLAKQWLLDQFIRMHLVLGKSKRDMGDSMGAMVHEGKIANLKAIQASGQ